MNSIKSQLNTNHVTRTYYLQVRFNISCLIGIALLSWRFLKGFLTSSSTIELFLPLKTKFVVTQFPSWLVNLSTYQNVALNTPYFQQFQCGVTDCRNGPGEVNVYIAIKDSQQRKLCQVVEIFVHLTLR